MAENDGLFKHSYEKHLELQITFCPRWGWGDEGMCWGLGAAGGDQLRMNNQEME